MKLTTFQIAQRLYNNMYNNAPYKTGNLQENGIKKRQFSPTSAGVVIGGQRGEQAPYGVWLHFGTKHTTKHKGWITNVLHQTVDEINKELGGRIE